MPLLSRNKSLPGSQVAASQAALANGKQQRVQQQQQQQQQSQAQPLVCESPLFGIRRQLPVSWPVSCNSNSGQTLPEQEAAQLAGNTRALNQSQAAPSNHHNQKDQKHQSVSAKSSSSSLNKQVNCDSATAATATSLADTTLGSIPKQITREQIHYAFSIMDTNSDGLIDLRDLSQMLANLGVPIDEAILSHVMSTVSKRGDHRISEQEFLHWIGNFIQVSDLVLSSDGRELIAMGKQRHETTGKQQTGAIFKSQTKRTTGVSSPVVRSASSAAASSSTSLVAQSSEAQQLVKQQMRQRRGSGSGLALMRSLSSSATTGTVAAAAAADQQQSLKSAGGESNRVSSVDSSETQSQLAAELQQEARDDLKAAFCVFDLDGDGYITIDEVQQGLKLLGETWSQAELNQLLFSKCDPNNNSNSSNSGSNKSTTTTTKSSNKRTDLNMKQQQQQQQRISIDDFVKLLL